MEKMTMGKMDTMEDVIVLTDDQKKLLKEKDLARWNLLNKKSYVASKERYNILKRAGL